MLSFTTMSENLNIYKIWGFTTSLQHFQLIFINDFLIKKKHLTQVFQKKFVLYLLEKMCLGNIIEFALVDDLHCNLLPGENVSRQLDDGEVPPTEGLFQVVQASNLAVQDARWGFGGERAWRSASSTQPQVTMHDDL